jgi:hypothetical protein
MEYKTVKQLEQVAEVHQTPVMSRSERLERWAELLERQSDRRLNTFYETEYQTRIQRDTLRCDDSPISVAFDDPLLRAAGLKDDSYGEAKRFFELSDWELHRVVCYCHHGAVMSAETAARSVRAILTKMADPGLAGWVRRHLVRMA